jgi:predicted kinase
MKKKTIIINVGISGSGKTTWTKEHLKNNSDTLRVNRDSIRNGIALYMTGYYQRHDIKTVEEMVTNIEEITFEEMTYNHKNIVIDNTNLKEVYINKWIDLADPDFYDIKFKIFDIDKQYEQFKQIKKLIETKYKDRII